MRPLSCLAIVAILSFGAFACIGCSNSQQPPSDNPSATSGGNGTMGESPAHPGSYNGDKYNNPPATQPSGY